MVPWSLPITWWSFLICFVVLDLCRYWAHRVAHEQRFWWATHVTHHSSEQYNFTVSFRLSWIQQLKIIFFLPIAFMGIHPVVFFIVHQIEVLYQFWLHTELIKKLPRPIEFIFTTPSHHRVHHATNEKYLIKLWVYAHYMGSHIRYVQGRGRDALYGILKPVNSYNPVYLVFHEAWTSPGTMATYRSPKAWWKILFGSPNLTLDKKAYAEAAGMPTEEI